jgi:hypothetical protein
MDLSHVETFDWIGAEVVTRFERKFGHIEAQLMFVDQGPVAIRKIQDTDRNEVNEQALLNTIISAVPAADDPEEEVDKEFPVTMRMNTVDWIVEDVEGKIWSVDHILARTSFTTVKTIHPFKAHSYAGAGKNYEVASAAVAFGEHEGEFVLLKNKDEIVSVIWVPTSKNQNGPSGG